MLTSTETQTIKQHQHQHAASCRKHENTQNRYWSYIWTTKSIRIKFSSLTIFFICLFKIWISADYQFVFNPETNCRLNFVIIQLQIYFILQEKRAKKLPPVFSKNVLKSDYYFLRDSLIIKTTTAAETHLLYC